MVRWKLKTQLGENSNKQILAKKVEKRSDFVKFEQLIESNAKKSGHATFGSFSDHFWITFGSLSDHFRITFGSFLAHFCVIFIYPPLKKSVVHYLDTMGR